MISKQIVFERSFQQEDCGNKKVEERKAVVRKQTLEKLISWRVASKRPCRPGSIYERNLDVQAPPYI